MMQVFSPQDQRTNQFYRSAVDILRAQDLPFLVGGAFALRAYTGIERDTKDFDLMMRPADVPRAIEALSQAGYRAGIVFSHWLAKVHHGEYFIDIIYRAGNGLCEVDDLWFRTARTAVVFGMELPICPPEEIIWQKAFIMERERFDGADIQHIFLKAGPELDWQRLIDRFAEHWRVLLAHLVLFRFVYPNEVAAVPRDIVERLLNRALSDSPAAEPERLCRGPLISRAQYLTDIERWDYCDARTLPNVRMSPEEIRQWTMAIDREDRPH
jgi:hypothetical protein